MNLSDFSYHLPQSLIAQYALKKRDEARLLVVDEKTGTFIHDVFKNLNDHLPKESLLIVNNTKVVPARLLGQRKETGGKVEIFVLKKIGDNRYEVLLKPLKRLKNGDEILIDKSQLVVKIQDREARIVSFNKKNIEAELERIGHIPLPPYIERTDQVIDKKDYQTVYAKHAGSVASPTAGLHFTKPLIAKLKKNKHTFEEVTLHVNYGTFKPVEEKDVRNHQMHFEDFSVTKSVLNKINQAKAGRRPIVAVGTTSVRVLETLVKHGTLSANKAVKGSTNLFVYPGCKFNIVDALITNFHLPHSTLLMLVSAFGGQDLIMAAYKEAIKQKYRFYSYGDAMLVK